MLELLPEGSRQHQEVLARVDTLSRDIDSREGGLAARVVRLARTVGLAPGSASRPRASSPAAPSSLKHGSIAAALAGAALLLWKLKFVFALLLTKGKLLILGFTKMSTLFSMLLSFGVYWTAWGWRFALGLVLSIYVHEMGHVAALRRFGIRASAPMFIPGIGAMVRLKQYPATPREEARVSLAGPIWGMVGAAATYGLHLATGWASLAGIARVAAWINLFNLLPVWQLDGGRAFRALTRSHRWILAGVMAMMWLLTREGLLLLLLAVAVLRAIRREGPSEPDRTALAEFALLVVGLALLAAVPVVVAGP
jgi:Zn-dependent protease